jgi:hypothetical protein
MFFARSKLISILIQKKLYEEVDKIISISKQGFDIHVNSCFPEVEKVTLQLLEQELITNPRAFRLIADPKNIPFDPEHSHEDDFGIMSTILVTSEKLQSGYGFVKFALPSPDHLLSSVAAATSLILNHFGLGVYLDVFDANILSRLKQISKIMGLRALIDAVIHTAYLGGFHGDVENTNKYLTKIQTEHDNILNKNSDSLEKSAIRFLSYVVLRGEDAHAFLKASLSYYTVNLQGFSMTKASQVLKMSRTTLQEHLKIGEQLGVAHFFEGYN